MEIGTQSELPVGTEIGVQSEQVMTKDHAVQSESAVTKDSSVQYEYDVDPGKDAVVQTDFDTSSSTGAGTTAAAVGAAGLLGGLGALAAKAFGKGDTEDNVDEGEQNDSTATVEQKKKVEIAKNDEEPVTVLEDGASKSTSHDETAKSRGMNGNDGDDTTNTHTSVNAEDESGNVASKDTEKPINYADHQEEQGTRSTDNALDDNSKRSDKPAAVVPVSEGGNNENTIVSGKVADNSPSESAMRSISPADSATDLPNHDKNIDDNDNRMFTKAETDALIAAAVAAAMANKSSQPAEHKQDDNNNTLNDNHSSTEGTRQISTGESSTSNNIPTKRVLTDLAGKDDTGNNNANVPRRGSQQDIPIRPTSPPPAHLLTRVGHGSAISSTHRSSIGSISTSDKGKTPARSQLLRNAQQQQSRNRPPSTMSSLSPSEQRASIASSPYANSLRTEADPSHIGLITQTMIGDWLWKYTRKSVGDQLSDYRHKRYFWIHPYTRTLYWSVRAPGTHGDESKVKSGKLIWLFFYV
ncbi:meiotic cell cortex C-terminal pleckstrin homology-domain-containing protein [Circinella umbellata]|nr:meiotic cell cortex C-terminal pleckstrin homology-domain-containing protein [Circinella umbellata]